MRMWGLLLALLPLTACAQVEAAPKAASPAQAAAASSVGLDYFAGRWTAVARDPRSNDEIAIDYQVSSAVDGAWLRGIAAGPGFQASDMWGRDPTTGGVVRVIFDGSGVYAIVRGAGWKGDTLVLEGDAYQDGGPLRVRQTIRRRGADEFEAVWEAYRSGAWAPYSLERVTRRR